MNSNWIMNFIDLLTQGIVKLKKKKNILWSYCIFKFQLNIGDNLECI